MKTSAKLFGQAVGP